MREAAVEKAVIVEKEAAAVEEGESDTARAAPVAAAAAVASPSPAPLATTAPPSAKALAAPEVRDEDASRAAKAADEIGAIRKELSRPGGLEMPLRELEVAAGAAFLLLTLVTLWMVRRRSSRAP